MMNNLTKTDDILLELNREVARYITGVRPFQYKNKTYRLIDNYVAVPFMRCEVCGGYPAQEVSVIESDNGKTLNVGNECIDDLIGQKVSVFFTDFRRKRESAMADRQCIDQVC
jgi:hypothetical protein